MDQPTSATSLAAARAHPETGAAAFGALVVANSALAFGPLFVRLADVGPVAAAFWRMALALPLLGGAALVAARRTRGVAPATSAPARRTWLLALAGLAFAADLGTWHAGILQTTMANATLLGNSATFLFPLWGFLVARTWPTRWQGLALLLAAAGAALLMGRSYQLDPRQLGGDLLCVCAGVLYAIYFILMSDVRRAMAPLPALALSSAASLLPLLVIALALGERIIPGNWTPLLGVALVSQVIGQGCMIYALGRAAPLVIGLALLIQPMVATAVGWVWFGETLGGPDLVGVAMIAAALVLVRREREGARPAETLPAGNPVTKEA
ncbi:DMT family transporter [Sphingomonas sp. BK345]|uniref:DMT family transporter n=1 Tax=Sphingomonas sp. BK345 TaxID=2586980 RepID=UPI0016217A6C|nr:DMT family transporter [Sphingomonas sp. BK345]MBB3473873.1 drug/metabolite transporter (DMT)-like permease [Sphingomonas sp. BK345]